MTAAQLFPGLYEPVHHPVNSVVYFLTHLKIHLRTGTLRYNYVVPSSILFFQKKCFVWVSGGR